MGLLITKGMKVWIIDRLNSNEVVEVKRVTAVNFGTSPADDIDTTDLEATISRTFEKGLKSPSAATLSIMYDTAADSHAVIKALEEHQDTNSTMIAIGAADGAGEPSVDSSGNFNFPTTRTFMAISGFVSDFPVDIQISSTVPVPCSIRRTSGLAISRKQAA
jgi:hypothetical protein